MKADEWLKGLANLSLEDANRQLQDCCGIVGFLNDTEEIYELTQELPDQKEKEEYGDWQTNYALALSVCRLLKNKGISPQIIIEPTCGKGTFLMAATEVFDGIECMYGVEIYKPYLNALKMQVLENALNGKKLPRRMELFHSNVFDFDFQSIKKTHKDRRMLVLGNPPWITNSKLGSIKSSNLPKKSNFKHQKGIEAITGKGNFDIAEYICNMMIQTFSSTNGNLAFLIKNSVVKSLLQRQRIANDNICSLEQYNIDADKEFGVAVASSLLLMEFGLPSTFECKVYDFYTKTSEKTYGWVNDKFVADTEAYKKWQAFDNQSQLEWWSGLKHDCSKVMELTKNAEGQYTNALGEIVDIEDEMIYPLAKSSDISSGNVTHTKKYVIVTQHSPSESTDFISHRFPKTFAYLMRHADLLDKRGSVIYKKRPRFAMFGIGDYSFKNYKVAISALYKKPHFSLVEPVNGRPVMLDDTCYLTGFDSKDEAQTVLYLLNHDTTQVFLKTLIFSDAKRVISKELLMRIDIAKVSHTLSGENSSAAKYTQNLLKRKPRQLELF